MKIDYLVAVCWFLTVLSVDSFLNSLSTKKSKKYLCNNRHAISKTHQEAFPSKRDEQVLQKLGTIIDPDLGQDIVSLGFIKNLTIDEIAGFVSFAVELTTPACPIKERFKEDCQKNVKELSWVQDVQVTMTAQEPKGSVFQGATGLSKVSNIIAVSSCKGGVGKSTTAVNLAFTLAKQGARVGILDADIYGPSLPIMVTPEQDQVEFIENQIKPLERDGVKLMSFGYVNPSTAIMRGAMVTQLIQQFVLLTSWGELDYLVVDMPPGTGDIQLTLTQVLNITAAVIVTTPQKLSFTDVVKGIDMFDTVNVPSIAVVENMASYQVPDIDTSLKNSQQQVASIVSMSEDVVDSKLKSSGLGTEGNIAEKKARLIQGVFREELGKNVQERLIFGPGHRRKLAEMWGIEHIFSMPLVENIASQGDSGTPYVVECADSVHAVKFKELASSVVQEVAKLKYNRKPAPEITVSEEAGKSYIVVGQGAQRIPAKTLRAKCRCAACVEEFTGRQIISEQDIPESIKSVEMSGLGNYAIAITWSDGHKSLYPYKSFVENFENIKQSPFSKGRAFSGK